jgi:hypothetical protein
MVDMGQADSSLRQKSGSVDEGVFQRHRERMRTMNWNLEGLRVNGLYMGMFPISGTVNLSRVKYGGEVAHHLTLDEPIKVYGAMRERIILEHKFVNRILAANE